MPKKAHFDIDKIKAMGGCTSPHRRSTVPIFVPSRGGVTVRRFIQRTGSPIAAIPAAALAVPANALARRRGFALIVSALACLCSTAAVAQWNARATASLGRGYGNIALSQSILSGTRRLGAGASTRSNAVRPASLTPAQIDAALTYTADPRQSDRIRAVMIDTVSGQNATTRADMEKAFADDAVLKEFERFVSGRGYSSHNVADDMAERLVVCWEIYTGGTASKEQIEGTHQQVRGVFLGNPALRAMTNAQRQNMAERAAYQVVIAFLAKQEALRSGDQAQLAQIQQSTAAMLRAQVGIDISRLRLTAKGFSSTS
jgi:hypothetical protein